MRTLLRMTGLAAALVLAGACNESATESTRSVRALGYLEYNGEAGEVILPPQVNVNQGLTYQVITRGSGCTLPDNMEVTVTGNVVDLYPYDITTEGPGIECTAEVRNLAHPGVFRFETVGQRTFRVHGRRLPGGENMTITRTIEVVAGN